MITIRLATVSDIPALADLFREAALQAGPEYYSPQQVRAWAAYASEDRFRDFILTPTTLIAVDETGVVGFSGLERDGHVASLYVRPDRTRQGIGSTLLSSVLDLARGQGMDRLFAETNLLSRPLFEKFGFRLVDVEIVTRADAVFERYVVERRL